MISNWFNKDGFRFPRSVQDIIPIRRIWPDGTALHDGEFYSCVFAFKDINYLSVSDESKESVFLSWCSILNSFDAGLNISVSIINRNFSKTDLLSVKLKGALDGYDTLRDDMNHLIAAHMSKNISRKKSLLLTVSVKKNLHSDACVLFNRIESEISKILDSVDSNVTRLNAAERLSVYHDFFRPMELDGYKYDIDDFAKYGHSFKDYICPDAFKQNRNHFIFDDYFGRVLFIRNFPSFLADDLVYTLSSQSAVKALSVEFTPINSDDAIKEVENKLLGVETNIANWQRRQNAHNNFASVIPFDLEMQRSEAKEFLADLMTRDQKMFVGSLFIVVVANNLRDLDAATESVYATARAKLCQLGTLHFQQLEGLQSTLPFGINMLKIPRTLTTEALAALIPFSNVELFDKDGLYYGHNSSSKNLIFADRKKLLNGNGFFLGVPGAGKSFQAKCEIINTVLSDPFAEVIIIDPEQEYGPLVEALDGSVIPVKQGCNNYINPLDIHDAYGGESSAISLKSDLLLSMCESMMGGSYALSPIHKSLIDRALRLTYNTIVNRTPTLTDFYNILCAQPEPECSEIALALELFVNGSLDIFAKASNVNLNSRVTCYDIKDLGRNILKLAMLVILDSIFLRLSSNRERRINTYIYIDEIYLLLDQEYSASYLYSLWKRVRKYGGLLSGITQNVSDLLQSETAATLLSNSEFLVLLSQSASDRRILGDLIDISEDQMRYITNADAGSGLIKFGGSIIPFVNSFPEDSVTFRLLNTNMRK